MTRHLLLALAVLAPFAALVALGFSLLKDPPPMVLPAPVVRYAPVEVEAPPAPPPRAPPAPPARPMPPPLPTVVEVVVPASALPEVKPKPELSADARRLPIIAAVEPLIQQCFRDVSERVREPMKVTVSFGTTLDGGFENAVIKKTSWPDPHLTACILDSFEDARFEPSGFALKRQTHAFSFGGPDGGR